MTFNVLKAVITIIVQVFAMLTFAQDNSVLSSGKWYKLSVNQDAVYKIDFSQFRKMGINPASIDPRNVQLFASQNYMLPQKNSAPRTHELKEIAIQFFGADDGVFNAGDYLLFYGQGPDRYELPPDKGVFFYQNNIYSDKNFYFLTVGNTTGKRMETEPIIDGVFPTVTEFDYFSYYETERSSILNSGRKWYGERFGSQTEYTVRFDVTNVVENSNIHLIYNVLGQTYNPASINIFLNNVSATTQDLDVIPDSRWALKGIEIGDTLELNSNQFGASAQNYQDVKIKFLKAPSALSDAYIDFLLLQAKRHLALYNDQTIFSSLKSLEQPITKFVIDKMPENGAVWNISDSFNSKIQSITLSQGQGSFVASSGTINKYVAISNKNFPQPIFENVVENQNLLGLSTPNLLIVTAPEFIAQAQRLSSYRQSKNSISVIVATTTQIYNEFSGGKQDVTAIRDFVKYLYGQNPRLKNLLLFGRGSFDYLNHLRYGKNFVPIYQSRNSLDPVKTYSSDDYYAFLDDNEGDWVEESIEPSTMDIGVGRLPVSTTEQASDVVDKIIQYENQTWGTWRKKILFLADDGDSYLHQSYADNLAESIEINYPEFNTKKLFLDSYPLKKTNIGITSPETTAALNSDITEGVLILNYTGHGGELQLADEKIVDIFSVNNWKGSPKYPFMVTATCDFGRHDDPSIISLGETVVLKKNGGSIGLITATRPVYASSNFTLNKEFYAGLFEKERSEYRDLGSIFRDTKNNSLVGVNNRNYSLIADPSMRLNLPQPSISITSIKNLSSGNNIGGRIDTLKALSNVRITGEIVRSDQIDSNYKGVIQISLYEKPVTEKVFDRTYIDGKFVNVTQPFEFLARNSLLFRGQASVANGKFTVNFIMPKFVSTKFYSGKMSLYAYPTSTGDDASGSQLDIVYGGIESNPITDDKTPPEIRLFVGDTTFLIGGIANQDSRIIALLKDKSGINISEFDPNQNMVLNLDDTLIVVVNSYYQTNIDKNDEGVLNFPLVSIKPGKHTLFLSVSDIYGNRQTQSVDFYVSKGKGLEITKMLLYPNPFPLYKSATLHFSHNRSGEDLEAVVSIQNIMGQTVTSRSFHINNSYHQVELDLGIGNDWNGAQLSIGMYVIRLSVRSLTDNVGNLKTKNFVITD